MSRQGHYPTAQPKQFGNLHQRMKYVLESLPYTGEPVTEELRNAIFDLQTEVSGYKPVNPPYGQRTRKL